MSTDDIRLISTMQEDEGVEATKLNFVTTTDVENNDIRTEHGPENGSVRVTAFTSTPPNFASLSPKRRYRFDSKADLVLLKCVVSCGAHTAKWGRQDTLFDNVFEKFYETMQSEDFSGLLRPPKKTMMDRYKRLLQKRRSTNATNSAMSGIAEEVTETGQLVDDIIFEVDETEEERRAESNTLREREQVLLDSGNQIRDMAVSRQGAVEQDMDGATNDEVTATGSTSEGQESSGSKRRRRQGDNDAEDEMQASLRKDMIERQKYSKEKVRLKTEEIAVDKERMAAENERFIKFIETSERRLEIDLKRVEADANERTRRLEIDQKRFELDSLERLEAAKERSKVVEVLSLLAQEFRNK